jgi:hypothetical protein
VYVCPSWITASSFELDQRGMEWRQAYEMYRGRGRGEEIR